MVIHENNTEEVANYFQTNTRRLKDIVEAFHRTHTFAHHFTNQKEAAFDNNEGIL